MSTDVFSAWQAADFNASSLPTGTQAILATQDTELVSETGHFDPNDAFVKALVNALNAALGG